MITYKITQYLNQAGIDFSFEGHGPLSFFELIQRMMAAFEEKFPNKGFLIVIDEMLSYLKGRSEPSKLNRDLQVLQALGQACDGSRFKIIFGVQELIYHSPEFQFEAEMLQKVGDRFREITITKEDVAFLVKNRLLKKDAHQKNKIRKHLENFLHFFTDLHGRTEEYVELYPVHPSYFENFQRVRIGKSQRQILKTLSGQFEKLADESVPTDQPGLITYDHYWLDIGNSKDLMAIPDVRRVKEISDIISDKIESYFAGGRSRRRPTAHRIANAAAIKILQAELNKQNGVTVEQLVDDLCEVLPLAEDREFLIDAVGATAQQIVSATSGQYFDKDTNNGEFHLRVEGGINFDQKIKEYAAQMSDSKLDEYFFKFLVNILPLDSDPYRTGFNIWAHHLDWKSHKTYREGYIFLGHPNARSTTQPKQHYYLYFQHLFDQDQIFSRAEADEVYFSFNGLSTEFKGVIQLYGAALALQVRADSSQKPIYKDKIRGFFQKARDLFEAEYPQITMVTYMGKETPLNAFNLPGPGSSKELIFSQVASQLLEDWFNQENPDYPQFTQLTYEIAPTNFFRLIQQALTKVRTPEVANRDGEAILHGLRLWEHGKLDFSNSHFAKSILRQLKEKGEGKVLNQNEILECLWQETQLWVSKDYKIEAALEFVVLATLAARGEVEITLSSGKDINSTTLNLLRGLEKEDFYSFSHIKPPKGINLAAIKELFNGLLGRDLSPHLKEESTFISLKEAAQKWADRSARILHLVQGGFTWKGIEIVSESTATDLRIQLNNLKGFCDKLQNYTSEAKLKNFDFSAEQVVKFLGARTEVERIETQKQRITDFMDDISYLQVAKSYLFTGELKQRIEEAERKKQEMLTGEDKRKLDAYKKELEKLKEDYARWYLDQYTEHRISEREDTQKKALLDSDEHFICEQLKDAEFLRGTAYHNWRKSIDLLVPADPAVTLKAILESPAHNFDPREYQGQTTSSLKDLKVELEEITADWTNTLREILDDPAVKKRLRQNLLEASEQKQLEGFQSSATELTRHNILEIRRLIGILHKGLEKVELSTDSLKTTFNKPLTPDQAIEAFKAYIQKVTAGKDRDSIRIILK